MERFFLYLLFSGFCASVLSLGLLVASKKLRERYTAKVRYYAWLIIIISFLIPIRPVFGKAIFQVKLLNDTLTSPTSLKSSENINLEQGSNDKLNVKNEKNIHTDSVKSNNNLKNITSNISLKKVLTIILRTLVILWLLGMVGYAVYLSFNHLYYNRLVRRWSRKVSDLEVQSIGIEIANSMNLKKPLDIFQSDLASGPMLIGCIKPKILLPHLGYAEEELYFILQHEYVHYVRKDLWYKLLVLIVGVIHWFNPMMRWIKQEVQFLGEESCDEEVLKFADLVQRYQYTETMIGVIRQKSKYHPLLSTSFHSGRKGTQNRIMSIMDIKKKSTSKVLLFVLVIATIGSGMVFAAEPQQQIEPETIPWSYFANKAVSSAATSDSYDEGDIATASEGDNIIEETLNKKEGYSDNVASEDDLDSESIYMLNSDSSIMMENMKEGAYNTSFIEQFKKDGGVSIKVDLPFDKITDDIMTKEFVKNHIDAEDKVVATFLDGVSVIYDPTEGVGLSSSCAAGSIDYAVKALLSYKGLKEMSMSDFKEKQDRADEIILKVLSESRTTDKDTVKAAVCNQLSKELGIKEEFLDIQIYE